MTTNRATRWHVYDTATEVRYRAVEWIIHAAADAIAARGVFRVVLAGGSTPRAVYECLCDIETDWQAWQIWFGDERCLPQDDPARNSAMVMGSWLSHVSMPENNINIIRGELGAERAAAEYCLTLLNVPEFDLVLLGLGEDGHTASLFPKGDWGAGENAADVLPVFDAPYPPSERVSLSARRLSLSRAALFMVTGEAKLDAVNAWRQGFKLPAAAICPGAGVDVLLDRSCYVSSEILNQNSTELAAEIRTK